MYIIMAETVIKIDLLQHLETSLAGLNHTKFGFYPFLSFLIVVVIVILILLKTTFSQISIHGQLQVTIL